MESMSPIDHPDLVLLMLAAPASDPEQDGRCAGITRLEKLAYLVEAESNFRQLAQQPTEALHFKPYHYGPYTREIYDAVDLLVGIGLLNETRRPTGSGLDVVEEIDQIDSRGDLGILGGTEGERYVERVFELSDKGRYVAKVLADRVGASAVDEISRIKERYGGMSLKRLLKDVYEHHPDMTIRSRIKDQL